MQFQLQPRIFLFWLSIYFSISECALVSSITAFVTGDLNLNLAYMDKNITLPAKFMKFLIAERTRITTMTLPPYFCQKYRDFIPPKVTLRLRNGEEVEVGYVTELDQFVGMDEFFQRFNCSKGLTIAFQYNGGGNFWAHAISNSTSTELDAPIFDDAGCKFVKILLSFSANWGILACPADFVERFGDEIPRELVFRLWNGTVVSGYFDYVNKGIVGLQQVFRLLSMSVLDILLFTYYGNGVFDVSGFGGSCVEKPIIDKSLYLGNSLDYFEIEIKPSHVLEYCYGVYIPQKFQNLSNKWDVSDRIKVCHGTQKWLLQVKKRGNRVEIHKGWCDLRTCLHLRIGDYCVFKKGKSDRQFNIEVYKKVS